jgi:hypothetical protein
VVAALILISTPLQASTTYFLEDWEDGLGLWNVSNGVWEVGAPSYGTSFRFGNACAATNLDGAYQTNTFSRLESAPITLPTSLEDGVLWLGFWHWYSNSAQYGSDFGVMQVKVDHPDSTWQDVSLQFKRTSSIWAPYYVDITEYAGQDVLLGLLMDDAVSPYDYRGPGWYVDEIRIFDGAFDELSEINTFEHTDEYSWDGWYPSRGQWQLGTPGNGPGTAYSGTSCFGTVLNGIYSAHANARLISPEFALPASPADGLLYLSFMQYVSLSSADGWDVGHVQIDDGSGWVTLQTQTPRHNMGNRWTERTLDISDYSGSTVRLGFLIDDDVNPYDNRSNGWYIDDVRFSEGSRLFGNPERFENHATSWSSSHGQWECGAPTSGPGAAYSAPNCWATNLSGNYRTNVDDRLRTPWVTLDNVSPLYLRFQHWFSFSSSYGTDKGVVQIQVDGGAWEDLQTYTHTSGDWTQVTLDISTYANQRVRFGFLMDDVVSPYDYRSSGWYIDDFEIVGMAQQEAPDPPLYVESVVNAGPAQLTFPHLPAEQVVIYGSPNPNFVPSLGNRIAVLPGDTQIWSDLNRIGWDNILYYQVSVVDDMGNESAQAKDDTPSSVSGSVAPVLATIKRVGTRPNPFNPTTVVHFELVRGAWVDIQVYDLAGRHVTELARNQYGAGQHSIRFRADDLASGVYFARVHADGQTMTIKMSLLK